MMSPVRKIVIVGGGTAGWLTACILASEFRDQAGTPSITVTLIESPNIPTLGVGEGTWPSMRSTLEKIGLSETEFLTTCSASFKQGTLFEGWRTNADRFLHPFTPPMRRGSYDLGQTWQKSNDQLPFDLATCPTASLAIADKAPKQITTPQYAFAANYGYHLDAGEFARLLARHGTSNLGVRHVLTGIQSPKLGDQGFIQALITDANDEITGDLFIDCSGSQALLLGMALDVPLVSQAHVLFNNAALAVQVPHASPAAPITSCTRSTAQANGWIWDIALQHRRGIGYVHCTSFTGDSEAETVLRQYVASEFDQATAESIEPRKLSFDPGYRASFWEKNCIAIGMSSGFIEPMEASALVMVETSAWLLARTMPRTSEELPRHAQAFNRELLHHWQRIIHFLKLHYVLSEREGAYWDAHRDPESWPPGLNSDLSVWTQRPIDQYDSRLISDLFPAASYQYIYHGMGRPVGSDGRPRSSRHASLSATLQLSQDVQHTQKKLFDAMPTNRALLEKIKTYGQPKI